MVKECSGVARLVGAVGGGGRRKGWSRRRKVELRCEGEQVKAE